MEANNNKALREALEKIANYDYAFVEGSYCHDGQICADIARKALAEPPRNCDVGTAEEQDRRFAYQFCRVGLEGCINCKLGTLKHRGNTCGIHWGQMLYKKGAAG